MNKESNDKLDKYLCNQLTLAQALLLYNLYIFGLIYKMVISTIIFAYMQCSISNI